MAELQQPVSNRQARLGMEGVDLTRTVGWFTSLFPISLTLDQIWEEKFGFKLAKEWSG